MAEIRHLENRHDMIFFCRGWSDLDKISQTGAEWHVVIWSKSQPDVEFQYGGRLGELNGMSSQSHVSPCRVLPLGKFTCHIAGCSHLAKSVSWSCHITGCKNSICHIENRFFCHILFFLFFNAVWALMSGGFRIVSDTLVSCDKTRIIEHGHHNFLQWYTSPWPVKVSRNNR